MKLNRIYITGLFLSVFLSGKPRGSRSFGSAPQIGYEKTLHLIFPTEVKYYSIGGDYVIGEKVGNCPEIIRLKAAEENFPGETTLSVVTADTKFYPMPSAITPTRWRAMCVWTARRPRPIHRRWERTGRCSHFPGRNHLCGLWQYKCGG